MMKKNNYSGMTDTFNVNIQGRFTVQKLRQVIQQLEKLIDSTVIRVANPHCEYCGSTNVHKDGRRNTKRRGLVQTYRCIRCARRFTNNSKAIKKQLVSIVVKLRSDGLSLREIEKHLQENYGTSVVAATIHNWLKKTTS
jgi:transposase-like protein